MNIEDKAREFANNLRSLSTNPIDDITNAYMHGYHDAAHWVSVDKELPEIGKEVIFKLADNSVYFGIYDSNDEWVSRDGILFSDNEEKCLEDKETHHVRVAKWLKLGIEL